MRKVLIIVGPTATGKTALSYNITTSTPSEIVSADSIHVYRGLTVLSGKDIPPHTPFIPEPLKNTPAHFSTGYYSLHGTKLYLVDVVEPTYNFNVADYLSLALPIIESIFNQQKLPIIVGGTGFYIQALLDGIETVDIPPDIPLREGLENKTLSEITLLLENIDQAKYDSLNESDKKNKRRLIRAVEVSTYRKAHPEMVTATKKLENIDPLIIGLTTSKEEMIRRIEDRVDTWFNTGVEKEIDVLYNNYENLSENVKKAVGYREMFLYKKEKKPLNEAIKNVKKAELQYIKKQLTWFKRNKRIQWFDIIGPTFPQDVTAHVQNWLHL